VNRTIVTAQNEQIHLKTGVMYLNRQLLSTFKTLGQPKVEAAKHRIAEINPDVSVSAVNEALTKENGAVLQRIINCTIKTSGIIYQRSFGNLECCSLLCW